MNITKFPSILLYILLGFLLGSCNSPADSPYPAIEFKKITSMPGTGRASAVAFVINDKGYVTLGRSHNSNDSLKECWQYDPTLDNWTKKAAFPGIARVKAIAAVVNGKAYVGLGFKQYKGAYTGGILNDFWMYDNEANVWTQKATLPSKATDACVSFVFNNTLYIGSGFDGYGFKKEFWKYEPTLDKWTQLAEFPGPHRACAIACANSEHVYFGTGYRTTNENDWWEYYPSTDSWKQRKAMPDTGRENAVSLSINNRIFISTGRRFGGDLTGGHVKSDILEYDVARNVWYERGNIPAEGRENAIAFTINGKGYIGFGEDNTNILNDFWSFNP